MLHGYIAYYVCVTDVSSRICGYLYSENYKFIIRLLFKYELNVKLVILLVNLLPLSHGYANYVMSNISNN